MKRLLFVLLLFISCPLVAKHIVGGELELIHLKGFRYRINLIYYFDVANNQGRDPQQIDPSVVVYIYRKSDNIKYDSVELGWVGKSRVPYTQPDCSRGEVVTDKVVFTREVELTADRYNDPGGYYIMWARCCRNYTITNIISQDPGTGGTAAGQTFYLEFPPVVVNGKQFINSSPKDFPALNDYACLNKNYYIDFAGVDDDGDSLAYTLVDPLTTESGDAIPPPTPGPYDPVIWQSGFGLAGIVNGIPATPGYPDMAITRKGYLTVTPKALGLYVFAVKVEEYRNKIKIGETRRDFQMLVVDCLPSVPPEISGKKLVGGTFTRGQMSVSFANTVADDDRCILVNIKDFDATRETDDFQEKITLKAIALNFKNGNLNELLPAQSTGVIHNEETLQFRICFPACPYLIGGPYQIGIIAYDDACALPMSDTLRVNVDVELPHNERAKFNAPDKVTATLDEGDQATWEFEAHDADGDTLVYFALGEGFSLTTSGMKTKVTTQEPGFLKGELSWDAFCDMYDFTKRTSFVLNLLVDDLDKCDLGDPDTITYRLNVNLPPNSPPVIDTDLTPDPFEVVVDGNEKKIYDTWSFHVNATDADNDTITVRMIGDGFDPAAYEMTMPATSGKGSAGSVFDWTVPCVDLAERDSFNISFVAIDSLGKCRVRYLDSLVVRVKVFPPPNNPPKLSILNLNNTIEFDGINATVYAGEQLNLQLDVMDDDDAPADNLTVDLIDVGGDQNLLDWTFENKTGKSVLSSILEWTPLCSIFNDRAPQHDFFFEFRFTDDRCITAARDSIRLNVKVIDHETTGFLADPANVFTPNGDGINEYYSMEGRNESGDLVNILPPDNCEGVFQNVKIYNRWGRTVFTSTDRNFRWYGNNESPGVYYYSVHFTNRELKGTVSLRD